MARLVTLAFAAAAIIAIACGSSKPSTEDIAAQLSSIPAQPADLAAVVSEGRWDVASEGEVSGTYGDLTQGILATAAENAAVQPVDAYERQLQGGNTVRLEQPYPRDAYSAVLLFDSPGDAKAFFDAAATALQGTDWLSSHPELDGATLTGVQTDEPPLAIATVVDQILWQHSSGIVGEQTFTDDVLLLRDGPALALIRAPGVFAGTDVRTGSASAFETGLVIPVANRLHETVD